MRLKTSELFSLAGRGTALAVLAAVGGSASATAQTALTIYNDDFGVVRDTVPLTLESGIQEVTYSGVTSGLEPESVVLRDPEGKVALQVLEQSYRGDPVDENGLLQMFEGETIRFMRTLDGTEVIEEGRIVRAPSKHWPRHHSVRDSRGHHQSVPPLDPIIEMNGAMRFELPGKPLFPSLGDDSVLKPTLTWQIFSPDEAELEAQLSYLSKGMSWAADYNLILPENGETVTLAGWVSIQNRTGKTFEEARVKLIAGDVNKVEESRVGASREVGFAARAARPTAPEEVEQKKFDEFHMYTLPRRVTLRDQETKQVEFIRAENVQTTRLYVYDGLNLPSNWRARGRNESQNYGRNKQPDVAIYREFKNSEANNLGIPLPAGRTRFYRIDEDGSPEFTGENTIDHTPKEETVRVYLGNAFDLVGERTQTEFVRHRTQDRMRESFEIEIRNRSEEAVTVKIVEHLFRWVNWEITEYSHPFEKRDARTIEFPVEVPASAVQTVNYTVEYTW